MGRRNPSLTAALCVSLAVHGLGLSALAWWVILHAMEPKLAAIDRNEVRRPTAAAPPPTPVRRPKPPPPLPLPEMPTTPKDDSGEADGHGSANRSTAGEHPMRAREGYHQADLMRDVLPPDSSAFDDRKPNPAQAGEKAGANTPPTPAASKGTYHPDFVADAAREAQVDRDVTEARVPKPVRVNTPGPQPREAETPPVAAATPTPTGSADAVATTKTPTPVAPAPPARQVTGRHAVASDTDSVAFARSESFTFRDGKVEARQGLKVKVVQPRLGEASNAALTQMTQLHLVLAAYVDAEGNPYNVVVMQGSGSEFVDSDFKEAVYKWTLEARKDADGHPRATTWTLTLE